MAIYPASYLDGKTAASHAVELVFSDRGLQIVERDYHKTVDFWTFDDIRPDATMPPDRNTLRLTCRTVPDARLTVRGEEVCTLLRRNVSALHPKAAVRRRVRLGLLVASAIPVLIGLYFLLPVIASLLVVFVPQEVEDRFGAAVMRTVSDSSIWGETCDQPGNPGYAALDGLVRRLARDNNLAQTFTLHVVRNDIANAFAVPGGHIVILSGLIDHARSADEVAGVIAHEMGHVVSRHTMADMMRTLGVGAAILVITGDVSSAAALGGAVLINLSYSRDDETEADALAVRYLNGSGIGTRGLHDFFARLAKREEGDGMEFLTTHPSSQLRAERVGDSAPVRPALTDAEWSAVRAVCKR